MISDSDRKAAEASENLRSAYKKLLSSLGTNGVLILEREVLALIDLIEAHFHMHTEEEL